MESFWICGDDNKLTLTKCILTREALVAAPSKGVGTRSDDGNDKTFAGRSSRHGGRRSARIGCS
eukprot:scaffold15583_cov53-Cylindrotheca_fusiformis.AAC.1